MDAKHRAPCCSPTNKRKRTHTTTTSTVSISTTVSSASTPEPKQTLTPLQRTSDTTLLEPAVILAYAHARLAELRRATPRVRQAVLQDPARKDAIAFLLHEALAWRLCDASAHGSVALFDRVSYALCVVAQRPPRTVALACMWIQCKMHETYVPRIHELLPRLALDAAVESLVDMVEVEACVARAAAWQIDVSSAWTWLGLIALITSGVSVKHVCAAGDKLKELACNAGTLAFDDEALAWASLSDATGGGIFYKHPCTMLFSVKQSFQSKSESDSESDPSLNS
jgi:hypothetical protein